MDQQQQQASDITPTHAIDDNIAALIKKYSIPVSLPAPVEEDVAASKFILMRHGLSEHNFAEKEYFHTHPPKQRGDPIIPEIQLNPQFIDNGLHPIGQIQCHNQQKYINAIPFSTVFVSPMKRTLQTCIYMFSTHPNRQNIKFKVMPEISECLCDTGCLCPQTLSEVKTTMSELAAGFDIQLDFSLVEELGDFWQIRILDDKQLMEQLLSQLEGESAGDYTEVVVSALKKASSFYLEKVPRLYNRAKTAAIKLKQFAESVDNPLAKIGVVSHGITIFCLTASEITPTGRVEDGLHARNCQIMPVNL